MGKNIIFFLLSFWVSGVKGQAIYQLGISNLSKMSLQINLGNRVSKNVAPFEAIIINDTIGSYPFALVDIEVNRGNNRQQTQKIRFVARDKSNIDLQFYGSDVNNNGAQVKISGLPFPGGQATLKNFLSEKNAFTIQVRKEYEKMRLFRLTDFQKDSIARGIRTSRRQFLSRVEKLMIESKESYVICYMFESEFLDPKSILAIGKQKVISLFESLDTSFNKTEAGETVATYMRELKSASVGSSIRNFKFKTHDFREYDLHGVIKNSKALLIFTARGCKACIEQVPIIRKIEQDFKPNLEVVYVSLDRSVDEWNRNIESANYPGIMTINLLPYNYSVDLQKLFMVEFIPQVFLIDENFQIIYDNLSFVEDEKLLELKKILNLN